MKTIKAGLISLLLLTGCATQRGFEQQMQGVIGQDNNDVITRVGPPAQVFDMPNGDKMYTFGRSSSYTTPVCQSPSHTTIQAYGNTAYATTTLGQTYGGQTFTSSCTIHLRVDSSQRIVGYSYEGNACRVRERE